MTVGYTLSTLWRADLVISARLLASFPVKSRCGAVSMQRPRRATFLRWTSLSSGCQLTCLVSAALGMCDAVIGVCSAVYLNLLRACVVVIVVSENDNAQSIVHGDFRCV